MNMNSNASFPKWIKKNHLLNVNMPVFVMMGENEFAFSVNSATKRAKSVISTLELYIWLVHRPKESMFKKVGLIITSAGGSGTFITMG